MSHRVLKTPWGNTLMAVTVLISVLLLGVSVVGIVIGPQGAAERVVADVVLLFLRGNPHRPRIRADGSHLGSPPPRLEYYDGLARLTIC